MEHSFKRLFPAPKVTDDASDGDDQMYCRVAMQLAATPVLGLCTTSSSCFHVYTSPLYTFDLPYDS